MKKIIMVDKISKEDIEGLERYGINLVNNSPFDRIKLNLSNVLNERYIKSPDNQIYKCILVFSADKRKNNNFYVYVKPNNHSDIRFKWDIIWFKHLVLAEAYFLDLYDRYGNLNFWDKIKINFGLW